MSMAYDEDFKEDHSFYPIQHEKPLLERGVIKDFLSPKMATKGLKDIIKPSQRVNYTTKN